jgi:hypothetical protein
MDSASGTFAVPEKILNRSSFNPSTLRAAAYQPRKKGDPDSLLGLSEMDAIIRLFQND